MQSEEQLQNEILQRIQARFLLILRNETLDLDYLLNVAQQELSLATVASNHLNIPLELITSLQELINTISSSLTSAQRASVNASDVVIATVGELGRPCLEISPDDIKGLLSNALPIKYLTNLYDVSRRTLYRQMKEHGLSVRGCYSSMSDDELDCVVRSIKSRMPHAGYRLVKGELLARGYRVPWCRVRSSVQRVDGAGVLARMIQVGFVARRTYSVPAPLSLVHVDTNHKLIRFNVVIFGGIDGFSRRILYLDAAGNNNASTAFSFFLDVVHKHGWPSRVERLWRDVWSAVTCNYYEALHGMEEEGLVDLSDEVHLFCVHYVVLPRLRSDLKCFLNGWNKHPLRTEGNLSPDQLWHIGMLQPSVNEQDVELTDFPECTDDPEDGVVITEISCPLSERNFAILQESINPTISSLCHKDLYIETLDLVYRLSEN